MLHLPNGPGPQTTHSSNTCRVLNEPSQWTTTMENVSLYILRTKHCIIVQKFTPSISLSLAPENIIYYEKKKLKQKVSYRPFTFHCLRWNWLYQRENFKEKEMHVLNNLNYRQFIIKWKRASTTQEFISACHFPLMALFKNLNSLFPW